MNTHTWLPFWFFAILWALTSYILVTIVFAVYFGGVNAETAIPKNHARTVSYPSIEDIEMPRPVRKGRGKSMELPDGYYIRNTDGTEIAGGVPKYIYLGKGLPSD